MNLDNIKSKIQIGSLIRSANYNSNEEKHKHKNGKPIKVIKDNIDLGNYPFLLNQYLPSLP